MALAVVPAAGRSQRMGQGKLLLPFGDTTVLASVLRALHDGGVARAAVVASPENAERLRTQLGDGDELAVNPTPEQGMLSSILIGIDALGGPAELARGSVPLLVCPADLPALRAETVRTIRQAVSDRGPRLSVPLVDRRRGHPLAIAPSLVEAIGEVSPAVGLRQLLQLHPNDLACIPVEDPGAVHDLDRPEDYRELLEDPRAVPPGPEVRRPGDDGG